MLLSGDVYSAAVCLRVICVIVLYSDYTYDIEYRIYNETILRSLIVLSLFVRTIIMEFSRLFICLRFGVIFTIFVVFCMF
jgi:hypothetical protein